MIQKVPAMLGVLVATSVAATASASLVRGPHFVEPGDAGSSRSSATDVKSNAGSGKVKSLLGAITGFSRAEDEFGGDYQDVYRINIGDPAAFRVELETISMLNSMLFLFNEDGNPIMASANTSSQNFNPILDNSSGSFFTESGIYYLAISSSPSEAVVDTGGSNFVSLFNLAENPFGTVGPTADAIGLKWTDGWSPPDTGNVGGYLLMLDGVFSIPAPAALPLLLLATVAGSRRRR